MHGWALAQPSQERGLVNLEHLAAGCVQRQLSARKLWVETVKLVTLCPLGSAWSPERDSKPARKLPALLALLPCLLQSVTEKD